MHGRPYLFLNKYFNPHNEKLILSRFTPSKINFTHRFKSVSILSTFPPPRNKQRPSYFFYCTTLSIQKIFIEDLKKL